MAQYGRLRNNGFESRHPTFGAGGDNGLFATQTGHWRGGTRLACSRHSLTFSLSPSAR